MRDVPVCARCTTPVPRGLCYVGEKTFHEECAVFAQIEGRVTEDELLRLEMGVAALLFLARSYVASSDTDDARELLTLIDDAISPTEDEEDQDGNQPTT